MDYIAALGRNPTLLLVEDLDRLREEYKESLIRAGFSVVEIDDGSKLEAELRKTKFDVILSDTDMNEMHGDVACRQAFQRNQIGDDTLLVAMSDNSDNEKLWQGLAHYFFDKRTSRDMGQAVMGHYYNFKTQSGIWRQRMLRKPGRR